MIYGEKVSSTVVELCVFDDVVGQIEYDNAFTVTLNNRGNYMHLLPLITYVATTTWSNFMVVTEGGYVVGKEEL